MATHFRKLVAWGRRQEKMKFKDTIACLRKAECLDDMMDVMRLSFFDLGFSDWGYVCQVPKTYINTPVYVFMNESQEWIQRYLEMGYHDFDPLLMYYANNNLPLIWKADDDWSKMGDGTAELMRDMRNYGYAGGLCIPLFSAQNTRGLVNLISRDPSLEDIHDALEGRAAQIVLITCYVQEEIFRVAANNNENLYENPLSARQSEVLLWVGEGLTSKAIGEKMGISYRTVESYMVEIQNKMNVSNRQQAVTRAVSLGFIVPKNLYDQPVGREVKLVIPRFNK